MSKVMGAVVIVGLLGGCSSIITYISVDNSTDNSSGRTQCAPNSDKGGTISVRRDCIINQPSHSSDGVTTSTQRQRPSATKQEGPQ